jgi:hypothetical protein
MTLVVRRLDGELTPTTTSFHILIDERFARVQHLLAPRAPSPGEPLGCRRLPVANRRKWSQPDGLNHPSRAVFNRPYGLDDHREPNGD